MTMAPLKSGPSASLEAEGVLPAPEEGISGVSVTLAVAAAGLATGIFWIVMLLFVVPPLVR